MLIFHHRADGGIDLPQAAGLLEIFHHQLDRQAALNLELAVETGSCLLKHLFAQIRRHNFDIPAPEQIVHFPDLDRQRIRLLPG